MKNKELLRILEDLQSWDFEKSPLVRLDKEDTALLIELLLRHKANLIRQKRRYLTHREEILDEAKKRYKEKKKQINQTYYEKHKDEIKRRRLAKSMGAKYEEA